MLPVDAVDGRVPASIGYAYCIPAAKANEPGVMTRRSRQQRPSHPPVGQAACRVLDGTLTAGVIRWRTRRPRAAPAAPERKAGDRLSRSVVVTLVLLGLLFPLLVASLLVMTLIDRYAAARFSGLGRPTA